MEKWKFISYLDKKPRERERGSECERARQSSSSFLTESIMHNTAMRQKLSFALRVRERERLAAPRVQKVHKMRVN
jgi:hypothetical protein